MSRRGKPAQRRVKLVEVLKRWTNDGRFVLRAVSSYSAALIDLSDGRGLQLHERRQTPTLLMRCALLIRKAIEQRNLRPLRTQHQHINDLTDLPMCHEQTIHLVGHDTFSRGLILWHGKW